jgi:hypothetical protein
MLMIADGLSDSIETKFVAKSPPQQRLVVT